MFEPSQYNNNELKWFIYVNEVIFGLTDMQYC